MIDSEIMKQYVIDELRYQDFEKIKSYLDQNFGESGVDDLYWIPLNPELFTPLQAEHTDCHPLYFALELTENRVSCELLIRTRNRMRCDCIRYADQNQRNWILDCMDAILEKLGISI